MPEIIIAVDAMGGDNAPGAIIEGASMAQSELADAKIVMYGPDGLDYRGLAHETCAETIGMDESPVAAVRKKADSTIVRGMLAVREGAASAFVSAGSTGAILAGGMFRLGRLPGVERPAIAPVIPGVNKPFMLIDSGANADCLPKYLSQFGLMGAVYMNKIMGVETPEVGLVNIGAEAEKGSQLYKAAHELMASQSAYKFIGNVEAREVPMGACDVVAADGFTGNVILKYTEGLSKALVSMLKAEIISDRKAQIGYLFMKNAFKRFKARMDSEEAGGAPLLGVGGAVVKAHGSSSAKAIKNAIRQAYLMAASGMVSAIADGIKEIEGDKEHDI